MIIAFQYYSILDCNCYASQLDLIRTGFISSASAGWANTWTCWYTSSIPHFFRTGTEPASVLFDGA